MASPLHPDSVTKSAIVEKAAPGRIAGSALVPPRIENDPSTEREFLVWCGVLPSCPVEWIDVAGINFPKVTEELVRDRAQTGKWQRVPRIGAIVRVTASRLRALAEALPRKIVHVMPDDAAKAEVARAEAEATASGRLKNLGDAAIRPPRGHVRTIPSEAERKALVERNRYRPFVPKAGDEPAADYLFMVVCPDQKNPSRGNVYPEPLSVTGLDLRPE